MPVDGHRAATVVGVPLGHAPFYALRWISGKCHSRKLRTLQGKKRAGAVSLSHTGVGEEERGYLVEY